jgi:hypothetical protein
MAFRIHDSVVRGEIDNRTKGIVRGRIWVHGRAEPVMLELLGNAHPDLAGCLLTFRNGLPTTPHQHLKSLNPQQNGTVGDMTASRKVRVFDIPVEEAYMMCKRGEKPPEHMANSLYLEWYSNYNGRVVIESADYVLEISAPEWRLTPAEHEQRGQQVAELDNFTETTGAMLAASEAGEEEKEWDEFDFEKAMQQSDAATDKYLALREKYGDTPEAEELIAKEMGWDLDSEEGEPEVEVDEDSEPEAAVEEEELDTDDATELPQMDPLTEGVDWIRTENGYTKHPLCHRVFEGSIGLRRELQALGLSEMNDEQLMILVSEYQITGAKLAGALNSLGYGRDHMPAGLVVASLKRALNHLHQAQGGLESLAGTPVMPVEMVTKYRREFFEVREEILRLMQEFRGR